MPAVAPPASAESVTELDLARVSVRECNTDLQQRASGLVRVRHPAGRHNLAVGLRGPVSVEILGHAGYYCAGMNEHAQVRVEGNVGVGVAENMMSGRVEVMRSASQSAGASAHGGLLVVHGDAAARCAISLKGADIVVRGSVGHLAAFMGQSGRLVVCGDAGEAFGDSLYEANLFVRGSVAGLGADCVEQDMRAQDVADVAALLEAAGVEDVSAAAFRRYCSARRLYHVRSEHATHY
jgi:glutamate synthase domain-containing protein 3